MNKVGGGGGGGEVQVNDVGKAGTWEQADFAVLRDKC